jgi:DNA-binding CsgD family transcriptional regulator
MDDLLTLIYRHGDEGFVQQGDSQRGSFRVGLDSPVTRLLMELDRWQSGMSRRLADIARQIEENAGREDDWGRLARHIENAFPEFYSSIACCSPPLTPTERKVFLLIGMNISPGETATLLRCTRRNILKHRSSIRKKMCAGRDEHATGMLEAELPNTI